MTEKLFVFKCRDGRMMEGYLDPKWLDNNKTLRDEFAMASIDFATKEAINWMLRSGVIDMRLDFNNIAKVAYALADALIEERKK